VPSSIFRYKKISASATGLYCWLFSHTENQEITFTFIQNHFKEGRKALQNRIKDLTQMGFLVREQVREDGKIKGYNYILNDEPLTKKPLTRKPLTRKEQQSNNNSINNNINTISNIIPNDKKYDPLVVSSFDYFVELFPEKNRPKTKTNINRWLDILDKIHRIDKYDLREVYLRCKELRNDPFWETNFLSLVKLRNYNRDGIRYIDYFMYKPKPNLNDIRKKIPGAIKFYKYNDPSGKKLVGVKTINGDIDYDMLKTILSESNIKTILNEL
jgi:predicted transcriptional regulator